MHRLLFKEMLLLDSEHSKVTFPIILKMECYRNVKKKHVFKHLKCWTFQRTFRNNIFITKTFFQHIFVAGFPIKNIFFLSPSSFS